MLTIKTLLLFHIKPLPARVNSISFRSQYDECKDWWNSVCTVSESGAVGKSISEEYRCWLILSTFSRDILSLVLTFLPLPGERLGKWKCCYGILEAPRESGSHRRAAVMAYIMEFMARGGPFPPRSPLGLLENGLRWLSPSARLLSTSLLQTAWLKFHYFQLHEGL